MKSLRLSDLRKKSNKFYRNYGIINPKGIRTKTLEYLVERSFEALPKKLKEYVKEDKEQIIRTTTHSILVDGEVGQWDVYESIKQRAKYLYEHSGDRTLEHIYRAFREQRPDVYAKYNSYVYRLGESAAQVFRRNGDYSQSGSEIVVIVDLPQKFNGIIYNQLVIEYDFSGGVITFADMQ